MTRFGPSVPALSVHGSMLYCSFLSGSATNGAPYLSLGFGTEVLFRLALPSKLGKRANSIRGAEIRFTVCFLTGNHDMESPSARSWTWKWNRGSMLLLKRPFSPRGQRMEQKQPVPFLVRDKAFSVPGSLCGRLLASTEEK